MAAAQNGLFRCEADKIYLIPLTMLRKIVQAYFSHPLVRDLDIDSPEAILRHSRLIQEKSFLKNIYEEWYTSILASLAENRTGPILELGSGGGFLKDILPCLITSEILRIPTVDMVLDGQHLSFRKASLRGIVMIDVFHHLPDVRRFFCEAAYCVKPGGVIVMIEPWTTRWSRIVYKYLHHEPFLPDFKEWNFAGNGRLSGANSALPWIVFDRDRAKFEREFPEWRIKEIKLQMPFCYLLSGGMSFRSFAPGWLFDRIRRLEDKLQPWMNIWAMFASITLLRYKT